MIAIEVIAICMRVPVCIDVISVSICIRPEFLLHYGNVLFSAHEAKQSL